MKFHELKAIRQRIACEVESRADVRALVDEVLRLRLALATVKDMTGDPAIIREIEQVLEG